MRQTEADGTSKAPTDRTPVPDPTLLTTQQLIREVAALKEIVFTRLDGMDKAIALFNDNMTRVPTDTDKQIQHLKELHDTRFVEIEKSIAKGLGEAAVERALVKSIIETRLEGIDKATQLLQNQADIFPNRIDEKISSLAGVQSEKFRSIGVQFAERDTRTETSSRDSKIAVDAALQAAKEAVQEQNRSSALAIAKSETATAKQIDQQSQLIQSMGKTTDDKIDDLKQRLTRIEGESSGEKETKVVHQQTGSYVIAIVGLIVGSLIAVAAIIFATLHK